MSDQTNDGKAELSDFEKQELAQQEANARLWTKVQQDEAAKADLDSKIKNLGNMPGAEGRRLVREQWGFDPGWNR